MQILYFEVTVPTELLSWQFDRHVKVFYTPSHPDVVLAKLTQGTHSQYGLLQSPEVLALARCLLEESSPPATALTASNLQMMEYPDQLVNDLIGDAKELSRLDSLVMNGVMDLLKHAGHPPRE